MRKIFLSITFCLLCVLSNAQHFELTPEGFLTTEGNDFIVVDVSNTSAADIYTLFEKELIPIFPPSFSTFNKETANRIAVTSVGYDLFRMNAGPMMKYIMDVEYTIIIDIKDNKYRIHAPKLNLIGALANFRIPRMVVYDDPKNHKDFTKKQFIFNYKDRSVQNEQAKTTIEEYINGIISQIMNINQSNEDW